MHTSIYGIYHLLIYLFILALLFMQKHGMNAKTTKLDTVPLRCLFHQAMQSVMPDWDKVRADNNNKLYGAT